MKKNNTTIAIVAIAAVLIALLYFGSKNKSSTAINQDEHSHNTAAGISANSSLNDLAGKTAPAFSLTDRDGKTYSSDSLRGKNIVLFFNEGLMCYPACWNQITALAKDSRFKNNDIVALSIVVDSKKDWQKAVEKMPELADATVVFDNGAAVSKKFDVLNTKSSMHRGSLPGHTFVIIDKEGIVRYVFDDPNMGIRNDQLAAEILKLEK